MDLEIQVKNLINNINKDLNSGIMSTQSVFCKHINAINNLKKSGVGYIKLYEKSGFKLSKTYYYNLIHTANTRLKPKEEQESNVKPNKIEKKQQSPVKTNDAEFDLIDWKLIMPDIAEKLVQDLIKHGYSINTVKDWIVSNKIPNSRELRLFFNKIKNQK